MCADTAVHDNLRVTLAQRSLRGARAENQDACGARVPSGLLLSRKGIAVAIADGVSASEAGRIAAESSVTNFLGDYFATPDEWTTRRAGGQVVNALNRWLLGQGLHIRDTRRGYVTTFTGAIFRGRHMHVFHVGDTRLWRLRNGELERLTRDHRVLIDNDKPVLSRALGFDERLDVDYSEHALAVGDVYLFSTDGFHDFLDEAAILAALQAMVPAPASGAAVVSEAAAESVCEILLTQAGAHSDDNLTAIVLRVDALPDGDVTDVLDGFDALPVPPLLTPGQILDGLRIESVLAESPRSQVYRVLDEVTQQPRILKTPSPCCEDIPAVRREYATETWVLRRVRHPRLPRIVEPSKKRTALYVLTEPVEGETLRHWMQRNRQAPIVDVTQIVRQIATALRALHRRDIHHRDVRPENILLDANGQTTLIDFGQCRVGGLAHPVLLDRDTGAGTNNRAGANNETESVAGALEYAAPETTLNPRTAGESADQFSLAAVLYEMLTGRLPWRGELAAAHERGKFNKLVWEDPSHYNAMIPGWLDEVLKRALALDAARRFGDIAELEDALVKPIAGGKVQKTAQKPLLLRNPVRTWQAIAAVLFVAEVVTLVVLAGK